MPSRERRERAAAAKAGVKPNQVLHDFEGKEVMEALAVVRNAGDGLSEAMHFAPFEVAQGEERYLVLRVTCTDVQFPKIKPAKDDEDDGVIRLSRKHIFRASTGTFLDEEVIRNAMDDQERRLADFRSAERARKEQEAGIFRLPGQQPDDEDE